MFHTDVVLIHGAAGSRDELAPLEASLPSWLRAWRFDLLGHGGRPLPSRFGIFEMVDDLADQIAAAGIRRAVLFGYSLGGFLALHHALRHRDQVVAICTLGSQYIWDEASLAHAAAILDPERLKRLGSDDPQWVHDLFVCFRRIRDEGNEHEAALREDHLRQIDCPVLALNGDADPLVSADSTIRQARCIPQHQFAIYDGAAHPPSALPFALIASELADFARALQGSVAVSIGPQVQAG